MVDLPCKTVWAQDFLEGGSLRCQSIQLKFSVFICQFQFSIYRLPEINPTSAVVQAWVLKTNRLARPLLAVEPQPGQVPDLKSSSSLSAEPGARAWHLVFPVPGFFESVRPSVSLCLRQRWTLSDPFWWWDVKAGLEKEDGRGHTGKGGGGGRVGTPTR